MSNRAMMPCRQHFTSNVSAPMHWWKLVFRGFGIESLGEKVPHAADQCFRIIAVGARIQSCGIAHGLLILERLFVEQQESLASLRFRAKAPSAIKDAAFKRHIEPRQVGGRGEPRSSARAICSRRTQASMQRYKWWYPACLIYLTDGDGCYRDEPSEYPTLWPVTNHPSRTFSEAA